MTNKGQVRQTLLSNSTWFISVERGRALMVSFHLDHCFVHTSTTWSEQNSLSLSINEFEFFIYTSLKFCERTNESMHCNDRAAGHFLRNASEWSAFSWFVFMQRDELFCFELDCFSWVIVLLLFFLDLWPVQRWLGYSIFSFALCQCILSKPKDIDMLLGAIVCIHSQLPAPVIHQ